jgi:hypothetical protein
MKKHLSAIFAISLLVIVALACKGGFSTANISELKFSGNESGEPEVTSFATGDDIYAHATVSNASGKYKLVWRITYDDVEGKEKGQEIGTKSMEFEDSSRLWQTFSSPLPGEYKVEATLLKEDGEKLAVKSGKVTVTGSAPSSPKDGKKDDPDDES